MKISSTKQIQRTLGLTIVICLIQTSQHVSAQRHPVRPGFILENKTTRIMLDEEAPVILRYVLKADHRVLEANITGALPKISFYKGANPVYRLQTEITYTASASGQSVIYHAQVNYQGQTSVRFDLTYRLVDRQLNITLSHIEEQKDFYLFSVELPELMSVKADGDIAKLAIPADAGRLIDVPTANFDTYEYEIDWRNPILAGFAYHSGIIGVLDTKSIENHTIVSVSDWKGIKYGTFSAVMMHRLNEYDLPEFGTVIPAKSPQYYLKVQDSCTVSVSIAGDYDHDGIVNWVDGTKLLRKDIRAVPNPFYENKTFIRAFLARKGGTEENIGFDSILQRIRQFAARTDSAPYIIYLLGWQYRGHDSGYPSTDSVNQALGGYQKLVNLIKEAKKYHVTVTFYDNFDDSYPTHPGWDADVICRDPEGNLMKGGAWDGEQSYLISSYKYAEKSGLKRIRSTLSRFPIQDAYFIDVLAGGYRGGRKYDFNPKSPAGAIKNFEGKKIIIQEFNKHHIDIATEDFTGYFVGYAGTFGGIIDFDKVYFKGEAQIPLIPFIYHGKTSFGMKTSSPSEYVKTFLYGQRAQKFTNLRTVYTPGDYILDALPKQKLYGKSMKSYYRDGNVQTVVYNDGSRVEVNIHEDTYRITLGHNQVIAQNYTSFVPISDRLYLACSKHAGLIDYPLPADWRTTPKVHVFKIDTVGTRSPVPFKIIGGHLQFSAEAEMPYKVIDE